MKDREYEVKWKNFGLKFQGMELKSGSSASPTVILGIPYASLGINFSKGKMKIVGAALPKIVLKINWGILCESALWTLKSLQKKKKKKKESNDNMKAFHVNCIQKHSDNFFLWYHDKNTPILCKIGQRLKL